MSFAHFHEWLSARSLRRMAFMQCVVFGGVLGVFLLLAKTTISHDLASTTRAIMVDDMLDYVRVYRKDGGEALRRVTGKTRHDQHHAFRLTKPERDQAQTIFEATNDEVRAYAWEKLPPPGVHPGEFDWKVLQHPQGKGELRVLFYALGDGSTFWYGRTDADERAYLSAVMSHLGLLTFLALLSISVPVAWFGQRVLKPLQTLTALAQRIAGTPGKARLPAVKAINEVNEFADAFNHSQERIAALTQELHSVNDHLAHELKTPLARVRGNIEDLVDHYGDDDGLEAATRSLDEIDRTSDLIRNILAIRLGDSGTMRLHLELTLCFEFVSDIVETYTPAAEDRDLEFAFESESDGFVLMDRQRVRQAITNLLDNAFAYTPKGGSVTVVQSVDQNGLILRVQDSGPGLTEEDERRIWDRFVRGSAGTKEAPGTGLGLSLVRAVARAHSGDASCRNRHEGGSEFWIYLPCGPKASGE